MIFERFYDRKLAQASYLVGCAATGDALVIDSIRDVEPYVAAAKRHGLRLTHVTETHIPADFVSGTRELASLTGAVAYLSGAGGEAGRYAFAEADGAVLLKGGDAFNVGGIRVEALHTPGHTPEHLCFLVTDTARADRPLGVFTGDFIFVGDVGRPDLLERAAGLAGTMEASARDLFRSLQRFRKLPDYLQLWPGHGAGSACGKSIGTLPQSTLGYETLFNWAFQHDDEDDFVAAALQALPRPPAYFAEMKRVNREGPRVLGGMPSPARTPDTRLLDVIESGGLVIDTRPAPEFGRGHVPGTLNIPFNGSFLKWAGALLPYDREIHLLVGDRAPAAARDLALIGLDGIAGYFADSAIDAWSADGRPLGTIPQVTPDEVDTAGRESRLAILDVRTPSEWAAGHIPGGTHIPLDELPRRLEDLSRDRPVVVHCRSGSRAAIAASLLRAHGFEDVRNLRGGFRGWQAEGRSVEQRSTKD